MSGSQSGSGGLMSSAGLVTHYEEEEAKFYIDPRTVAMLSILSAVFFTTLNVLMI